MVIIHLIELIDVHGLQEILGAPWSQSTESPSPSASLDDVPSQSESTPNLSTVACCETGMVQMATPSTVCTPSTNKQ